MIGENFAGVSLERRSVSGSRLGCDRFGSDQSRVAVKLAFQIEAKGNGGGAKRPGQNWCRPENMRRETQGNEPPERSQQPKCDPGHTLRVGPVKVERQKGLHE